MQNCLILYCKEQAVLWEACKTRPCRTEKCLFGRAVKMFGTENIGSEIPARYSSVAAMVRDREKLLNNPVVQPPEIKRTPVIKGQPVKGGVELNSGDIL